MWFPDDGVLLQPLSFAIVLLFFHLSEFVLAAVYMRDELSYKSLLITRGYVAAMTLGLAEYFLELRFLPTLKHQWWLSAAGLAACVCGETLRKIAMLTAKESFTHAIKFRRRENHVLITHGVYRWARHPGYLGWLIWAVGTQLLLCNPVAAVLFALASWRFFRLRIPIEEEQLRDFFGSQYTEYAMHTPTLIPFIS